MRSWPHLRYHVIWLLTEGFSLSVSAGVRAALSGGPQRLAGLGNTGGI
jgi:hypothetical protein